ncbi:MAG TPA: hypothetical protein VK851_07920 [Anaerolineales bacterium]|nr:hypothetical protein [Anaerolineales bacterium]
MKRIMLGLLSGTLFLTACAGTPPIPQPITVSETPSPAHTSQPSSTPTITITPLPTIPTFTPTFDVSTIVTVTPAPKAECPEENPELVADFSVPDKDSCESGGYCYTRDTTKEILYF